MSRFNLEEYETVEDRLAKFWAANPEGRVETTMPHYDTEYVVVRAAVYRKSSDENPAATGYAEEKRDATPVNKTSHVENCETSAIGRALANMGYAAKGKRPSREEMQKVERKADPVAAFFKANGVTKTSPVAKKLSDKFGQKWPECVTAYLSLMSTSEGEPSVDGLSAFAESFEAV